MDFQSPYGMELAQVDPGFKLKPIDLRTSTSLGSGALPLWQTAAFKYSTYKKFTTDDVENIWLTIWLTSRKYIIIIEQSLKHCNNKCSVSDVSPFAKTLLKIVCCRGARKRLYVGKDTLDAERQAPNGPVVGDTISHKYYKTMYFCLATFISFVNIHLSLKHVRSSCLTRKQPWDIF